jgi:Putative ABC exporter
LNSALWLLLKLRFKGWGRRLGRTVQTVKGAILTSVFALMILLWLTSVAFSAFMTGRAPPGTATAPAFEVERYGPLVLLIYCLGMVATGGAQTPFVFSPAEVQFLFSGPFSRRQLLTYKIISQFLLVLPVSLFMSFALRTLAGSLLSALLAALLTFAFMQLFGLTVNLVACALGEVMYSRARKTVLLGVLIVLAGAAFWGMGAAGFSGGIVDSLKAIEQTDVFQYAISPFKWFVKVLTAPEWDLDFFRYAAQALAVNLGMLALVYGLDARYMEQAAANSERRYARLQKMRSGGIAGLATMKPGKPRFHLTPLPRLGGVGPIVWRQMLAAMRSHRILGILVFATVVSCIGPVIAATSGGNNADESVPYSLAAMALVMSMLLNQALAFDFRADVDRIEVLKSLPIPAWRIAVGQLITPVLYSSLYQIFVVGVLNLVLGHLGLVLAFTVALAVPVNLLLTGVENWLFLLFPARMGPAHPGDFSHAGRQMLLMFGKGIALMFGLGLPAVFAATAFYVTGQNWFFAVIAAFFPAIVLSFLPIPLVTLAFKNFDVSRDTPP